jgi:hypothetical protein
VEGTWSAGPAFDAYWARAGHVLEQFARASRTLPGVQGLAIGIEPDGTDA